MSQELQRYWLTYPTKQMKHPVVGEMKKKFALTTQIRSATITEEFGQIALELTGEQKVIGAAVRWFRRRGVQVDHLALSGVT
ncbi:MAG: NIL domain-containing protein [Verrucomicrobiota bacterium]